MIYETHFVTQFKHHLWIFFPPRNIIGYTYHERVDAKTIIHKPVMWICYYQDYCKINFNYKYTIIPNVSTKPPQSVTGFRESSFAASCVKNLTSALNPIPLPPLAKNLIIIDGPVLITGFGRLTTPDITSNLSPFQSINSIPLAAETWKSVKIIWTRQSSTTHFKTCSTAKSRG